MPLSALPPHLQDVENNFPDDAQFGTETLFGRAYKWINKKTKTWFAFSYRCTEWWARWRKFPIVLYQIGGIGPWRYETIGGDFVVATGTSLALVTEDSYLSRIQYYKRWHFAIQWPLMISFHIYPNAADVPVYGESRSESDGKLWFAYWNHFDADLVYWMVTSIYIGRNWK